MWVSKKRFEDLELQVRFLKEKVNGRPRSETFIHGCPTDVPLRKGFNLLLEHLGLEYVEGAATSDKLMKVKK